MLLPEFQSNDIENYLVFFPICPTLFTNSTDFNWPLLPFKMGDLLQKAPSKTCENNKQDFYLFCLLAMMTLCRVHVFRPLGIMESLE